MFLCHLRCGAYLAVSIIGCSQIADSFIVPLEIRSYTAFLVIPASFAHVVIVKNLYIVYMLYYLAISYAQFVLLKFSPPSIKDKM